MRDRLPRRELDRRAEQFLRAYHPSLTIPVPIETIVEHSLQLDVFPFPNLERIFGVDSFLSFDKRTIYVDQFQMVKQELRYRVTLLPSS